MVALQGEAQQASTSLVTCFFHGMGEGLKKGEMSGSEDVRLDLGRDEMIRDQRAGEG